MKLTIFFPRFKTFSGAEHLVFEFTRFAADHGHEVTILARGFDDACRPHLDPRIDLRLPGRAGRLLTGEHLVDSLLDVVLSPLLLRQVPKGTDVLCFLCDPTLPALWLYKGLLRGRLPAAYYCLQPPRFAYDLTAETAAAHKPLGYLVPLVAAPYRLMDRRAARRCDLFLAICEDYAAWCRRIYDVPSVGIVYPGVDLDLEPATEPDAVRRRHGVAPDELLIVTVNKLIARKNVDLFLRAMARTAQSHPRVRGIVVGDGPVRPALEALHHELGLGERVIFTGFVDRFAEVASYYQACDAYAFLEKNVPFGLTVLEAGVFGKPVIAVRGGGTLETVIDGETGFLIDPALDVDEVAARIAWLVEHPAERRAMGERAARHARRFSWSNGARSFVDQLERLAARHAAGNAGKETPPPAEPITEPANGLGPRGHP